MSRNEARLALSVAWIGILLGLLPQAAHAQAFAHAKSSLTDYSRSDLEPRRACASLAEFRDKELVKIEARVVPEAARSTRSCCSAGIRSELMIDTNSMVTPSRLASWAARSMS